MAKTFPLLIASDHAGFELKESLKTARPDLPWEDLGPFNADRVDYPDFAFKVAERISADGGQGVLICGSGQGVMMAANRFAKVRAALPWTTEIAKLSRSHNDANVLCLAARFTTLTLAKDMLQVFLTTEFEGGRHADRVNKLKTSPSC